MVFQKGIVPHNKLHKVGMKYNRLVFLEEITGSKPRMGKFLCECGNIIELHVQNVANGYTSSCGCYRKEVTRARSVTHGKSRARTYAIWLKIKRRCLVKEDPAYPLYGGRGIKMCNRWAESFENFLSDMGECPGKMSIDRIDNNGNYEPKNCRWASAREQANNRSTTFMVTAFGKTLPLSYWSELVGIPYHCMYLRLKRRKWSPEKTILTPQKSISKRTKEDANYLAILSYLIHDQQ